MDDVALDHGFESLSGFGEALGKLFGGPQERRRDPACLLASWFPTPLGPMVGAANENGVCFLEFSDPRKVETQFATLRRRFASAIVPGENPHLERLRGGLAEYFAGDRREFSVPLVHPGTPFQVRVWEALLRIPYGETRSYIALARAIATPGAVRAVGQANGRNPICIVIPCHRVVNEGGKLGGYGGGLWRKERLLALERGQAVLDVPAQAPSQG